MPTTTSPPIDRGWRDFSAPALTPLLHTAAEAFLLEGYHGTTMRTLASRADLSVAGLYHHYPSKQTIMIAIMQTAMQELHERSVQAMKEAGDAALRQAALHIECLVLFHAHRGDLAFLASSEIRSLEPAARSRHIEARDRQQAILEQIISRGIQQGSFSVRSAKGTARALITMCTGVSQWFDATGPLSAEDVADEYSEIALRALGVIIRA
ncbi:TetR/AcrR family transcriptional regulator [uncultured Microbacterium sp.]|uniref:TetR/AcrR family transcriptional regulator n=1 Tax=uncultured Microbacterium sp. TaxID=191216 RepID=UPI0035CB6594